MTGPSTPASGAAPAPRPPPASAPRRSPSTQPPTQGQAANQTPDDHDPWASVKKWWHNEDPKVAVPRDIGVSVAAILVLLVAIWVYTGQPFPGTSPMVVVESGSMMHPEGGYGRVGTIDPGDLVLVKATDPRAGIETAYGGAQRTGYGGAGDVIIFWPYGNHGATPIIHRAMTWVEVIPTVGGDTVYDYVDDRGVLLHGQPSVTIHALGLVGKQFPESGYVTRGDNPATNRVADQVSLVSGQLIQPDWIIGKARGELPWLGLLKLGITGQRDVPANTDGWCKVGKAWSPCDTWVMLGLAIGGVVAVPFALDMAVRARDRQLATDAVLRRREGDHGGGGA